MKTLDDHFRAWHERAFPYGYGTGELHTLPALRRLFELLEDGQSYWYSDLESEFGPLAAWMLIDKVNSTDLFDYGTSPRGGFLSEKGRALRNYVLSHTLEELSLVLASDDDDGDSEESNPFGDGGGR